MRKTIVSTAIIAAFLAVPVSGWAQDSGAEMPQGAIDAARKQTRDRLSEVDLAHFKGETASKAAEYSIESRARRVFKYGGVTKECATQSVDVDAETDPIAAAISNQCEWRVWENAAVMPDIASDETEARSGDPAEWAGVAASAGLTFETYIQSREYTLSQCPTLINVMEWLEGFDPTSADIRGYGEDADQQPSTDLSTFYRSTISSGVKGGDLMFTYVGYSGEPADVAIFLSAALDQCDLETSMAE